MIFMPRLDRFPLGLLRGIEATEYPFSIPLLRRGYGHHLFHGGRKEKKNYGGPLVLHVLSSAPYQWTDNEHLLTSFSLGLMTTPV